MMKKSCLKTLIPKSYPLSPKFGFTLIELLVSISIIGIIFTIGLARYNQFNRRQILVQAAQELKSNLRLAQSKAFGAEKDCSGTLDGYLVALDSNTYTIKSQCSQGGGKNYGTLISYPYYGGVQKFSGPSSILFKVLAQGVVGAGTVTLRFPGMGDVDVTVTATGEIYSGEIY